MLREKNNDNAAQPILFKIAVIVVASFFVVGLAQVVTVAVRVIVRLLY